MLFEVKSNTYLYLAVLLFLIPLQWLLAWIIAVIVHETSHYIAVVLCGGQVCHLTVSIGGVTMQCCPMTETKQVISILCGPVGGLTLLAFYSIFPQLAVCAWLLSAYNLLPILPLDGGRVLQILMGDSLLFHCFQKLLLSLMLILSLYVLVWLNLGPVLLTVVLILFIKHRKTPCKKG